MLRGSVAWKCCVEVYTDEVGKAVFHRSERRSWKEGFQGRDAENKFINIWRNKCAHIWSNVLIFIILMQ